MDYQHFFPQSYLPNITSKEQVPCFFSLETSFFYKSVKTLFSTEQSSSISSDQKYNSQSISTIHHLV